MKINVQEIKDNIKKLDTYVGNYEEDYLNQNYCLLDIEKNWIGNKSKLFLDKVQDEQIKIANNIIEIKNIISIYNYIVYEYSLLGKKVVYNFNTIDKVNEYFNNYIDLLNQILNLYNNIPVKYQNLIEEQKKYFNDCVEIILNVKQKVNYKTY